MPTYKKGPLRFTKRRPRKYLGKCRACLGLVKVGENTYVPDPHSNKRYLTHKGTCETQMLSKLGGWSV